MADEATEREEREDTEETKDEVPSEPASARPRKKRKGRKTRARADEDGARSDSAPRRPSKRVVGIAVAAIVVVAGVLLLWPRSEDSGSGRTAAAIGGSSDADLTLVTADRNDLDCVAAKGVQKYECGFSDEQTARQIGEREKLRPFMTLDRQLYLIPGLFLEPAISKRSDSEPPNKPRDQLKRFTAKCRLKVIGEIDGVKLRWAPGRPWEAPRKIPVATASGCNIQG
jgi:hypothetical protein